MTALDGVPVGRWHHHRCLLLDRAHGGACIVPPDDDPLVPAGPPRTPRGPRSFRPMHFGHAHRVLARRDRLVRRWLDRTGAAWSEALAGGDAMRSVAWARTHPHAVVLDWRPTSMGAPADIPCCAACGLDVECVGVLATAPFERAWAHV